DVHGVRVVETLDDAQLTELAIDRQSVAALRFAGRRPVTGHLVEPRSRGGCQVVLRRRPGRGDGPQDAPSFGRDLRVRRAGEPALQFLAPIAGDDQMRVGIDETRNDAAPACIDPHGVGRDRDVALQRIGGTDKDDRAIGGGNRRAPEGSDVSLGGPALWGRPRAGDHQVGILDDEVRARHDEAAVVSGQDNDRPSPRRPGGYNIHAMNKVLPVVIWVAIAALGAAGFGVLALSRGETISAAWLVIAGVCTYLVAYRFYSRYLAYTVFGLADRRATPAERLNNGRDFVPTNKWVAAGHHFSAISGAGPLVGPTLAAQFGFLPGTLWLK